MQEEKEKENIWNVPNFLTLSRIIISFVVIYFIFADFDIIYIVVAFVVGMLTDAADGQIARRFGLTTEFGRKFDIIADRFLLISVIFSVLIKFSIEGVLTGMQIFQMFLIMSREIITFPFIIMALIYKKGLAIPQVRFIGKATTVMQTITLPMILLSMFYAVFNISLYFAIATGIIGFIAVFYYVSDIKIKKN